MQNYVDYAVNLLYTNIWYKDKTLYNKKIEWNKSLVSDETNN